MRESEQETTTVESRYAQAAGWQMRFRRAEVHGEELSPEEFQEAALFLKDEANCRAFNLAELLSLGLRRQGGLNVDVSAQASVQGAAQGFAPASAEQSARAPDVDAAAPADNAVDDYDQERMSVAEWRARASRHGGGISTGPRRLRMASWALAAAAAIALSVVGFQALRHKLPTVGPMWPFNRAPVQAMNTLSTGPSETREVVLADGSHVTLGAKTTLRVRYTPAERMVTLVEGEARFSVEHDVHPFIVAAGSGRITALGTQFDVRRGLDRVTVTVAEGAVLVAPAPAGPGMAAQGVPRSGSLGGTSGASSSLGQPGRAGGPGLRGGSVAPDALGVSGGPSEAANTDWQPVRLASGEKVSYDEKHDRGTVEQADLEADQGVAGRFVYRDIPIKYVIEDINRYRSNPIVLKDPAAGEYEFTGVLFADHSDDWLRSVERILPVRVVEEDGHVFVESRSMQSTGSESTAEFPASSRRSPPHTPRM